jgi:hypothetical protein
LKVTQLNRNFLASLPERALAPNAARNRGERPGISFRYEGGSRI